MTGRSGRPPLTNRSEVFAAAAAIGFDGLTVGAVTAKVGVKYSTFYRHYEALADLVAELVDHHLALALTGWCSDGPSWREQLDDLAVRLVGVTAAQPGIADALASLPEYPVRLRDEQDRMIETLASVGFTQEDAELGVYTVVAVATSGWCSAGAVELLLDGLSTRLAVMSS